MTRIGVHGAAGRMGRAVIDLVLDEPGAELSAALEHAGHVAEGQDAAVLAGRSAPCGVKVTTALDVGVTASNVVIDFSTVAACPSILARCAANGVAAVVGTTGLDAACKQAVAALATKAPVVVAPNFSIGVNTLWALAERAVQLAGQEFDLEIVEMHHNRKVDAPSGTALKLADIVAAARGVSVPDDLVHGRHGQVGARRPREIGMHALRGGDVVGDHTLVLAGPGERIEITHRAHGRQIFARGAVRAALWVVSQPPGLYGMADVLGVR